jgi:hypothetical protein
VMHACMPVEVEVRHPAVLADAHIHVSLPRRLQRQQQQGAAPQTNKGHG